MKHKQKVALTAGEEQLRREVYNRAHLVLADEGVEDQDARDRIADRFAHESILAVRQLERT